MYRCFVAFGRSIIFFIATLLVQGCSPMLERSENRGTTTGTILVSSPKILSRETLFNDRAREAAWLRKTLDASDDESVTDLQGLTESNRFSALEVSVQAQVGPQIKLMTSGLKNQLDNSRLKQTEEELDHKIRMAEKRAKLAKLLSGEDTDAGASAAGTSSATADSGSKTAPQTAADDKADDKEAGKEDGKEDGKDASASADKPGTDAEKTVSGALDNLKAMRELLGSSKDINPSKAGTSAIDRFRARVSLREEIRGELHETELDDRHQLLGSTVYRMKFDATVFPGNDTEAWAVVDYEVLPPSWDSAAKQRVLRGFENALKRRIEEEAYLVRDLATRHLIKEIPDYFQERMLRTAKEKYGAYIVDAPPGAGPSEIAAEKAAAAAPKPPGQPKPPAAESTGKFCDATCQITNIANKYAEKNGGLQKFLDDWIRQALQDQYNEASELSRLVTVVLTERYPYLVTVTVSSSDDFYKSLLDQDINVYAYAATPKEVVQRISQTMADRDATQFLLGLSLLGGAGGGDVGFNRVIQSEQLAHALRQQPLVVGYTDETRSTTKAPALGGADEVLGRFGWIQGPRFELGNSSRLTRTTPWRFRHKVVQNALSATLAVPAWWDRIRLRVCTAWVPVDKVPHAHPPCKSEEQRIIEVPVKANYLSIMELFNDQLMPQPVWTSPSASENDEPIVIGQPADIAIYGWNLWRASTVLIGSQRADEVYVMPDGKGIIARFNSVKDHGSDKELVEYGVSVWTSHGSAGAKSVKVRRKPEEKKAPVPDSKPLSVALASHAVVTRDQKYAMALSNGSVPAERKRVRIEVKTGEADWAEVKRASISIGPVPDCGKDRVCFELSPEDAAGKVWPANGHAMQSRLLIELTSGDIVTLVSTSQPYYREKSAAIPIDASVRREDAGKPESVKVTLMFPVAFQAIKPEFDPGKLKLVSLDDAWKQPGTCKKPSEGKWIGADGKIKCEVIIELKDGTATKVSFKVIGSQDEALGLDEFKDVPIGK